MCQKHAKNFKNVQICWKYVKYWKHVIFLKNGKYDIFTYSHIFVESRNYSKGRYLLMNEIQVVAADI